MSTYPLSLRYNGIPYGKIMRMNLKHLILIAITLCGSTAIGLNAEASTLGTSIKYNPSRSLSHNNITTECNNTTDIADGNDPETQGTYVRVSNYIYDHCNRICRGEYEQLVVPSIRSRNIYYKPSDTKKVTRRCMQHMTGSSAILYKKKPNLF